MNKKPSFLQRLTGSMNFDTTEDDGFESGDFERAEERRTGTDEIAETEESVADGELAIDMYQTGDAIIIRALVAGVNPEDLEIAITRDMVTLRGSRQEIREVADDDYHHRELFWGSFSRTIMLPDEILIDEAEAREKHGLLEIVLPKVDKNRSTRLSVRSQGGK